MANRAMRINLHDKVSRYDYPDVGEVRQVISEDRVVVYWPDDPRSRSFFSVEWTEELALVDDGEQS